MEEGSLSFNYDKKDQKDLTSMEAVFLFLKNSINSILHNQLLITSL